MTAPLTLASYAAQIVTWYARLPEAKPSCFTCADLTTGIGLSMRQLHMPLVLLGWHRAEVWSRRCNRRIRRVLYAPPGYQVPRPTRGRPRFCLENHIAITIL